MSGFDNGTLQGGIFAQTKQFGPVLRGNGPPVPQAGVLGDLYMDALTFELYMKRAVPSGVDPWGHYLFVVPLAYRATLRFFSSTRPVSSLGANGDYCLLWGGYPNYGIQPSFYGPKAAGAWPANPVDVAVAINPLYTAEDVHEIP